MSQILIDAVASELNISKAEATKSVKAVENSIKKIISETGGLTINNFGTFSVKPFKRTSKLHGKVYEVDKNIIRFKPSPNFSKSVN